MPPKPRKIRVAYLVTHPIQYQAPLLRRISAEPDIDLKVFFESDISVRTFSDPGFGRTLRWDTDLLGGYEHEFLPALGPTDRVSTLQPLNFGFARRLREGGFTALWVHGYMRPFHWHAILAAKRLGLKVLVRDEATAVSRPRGPVNRRWQKRFFRWLRKRVDAFLAIGSLNRQYYLANGIDPRRVFLMPYAVDNEFFQQQAKKAATNRIALRRSLGLREEKPVVLFAGKMIPRKRPSDLLRAWTLLGERRPYLVFVGDGPLMARLHHEAAGLGSGEIVFAGFRNQSELPAFYDLCDLFVIPSEYEPWGLVVNEAMNAGRAIVAADQVGCAADLVRNADNGFLYRTGDVEDLARVLRLAIGDRTRLKAMGRRSLEMINAWNFETDVAGLRAALTDN